MKYDLHYRVIFDPNSYQATKHERVDEGYFIGVTSEPEKFTGSDAIHIYMGFLYYESYHYSFDAPTEERVNQWWHEGTRKFVMWDNVGNGKREKTKFAFELKPSQH